MKCPRREENPMSATMFPGADEWVERSGKRVCSYCGSLHPDEFMDLMEKGTEIDPTDKSYKAYIDVLNPEAGQVVKIGSEGGPVRLMSGELARDDLTEDEIRVGRFSRPIMGKAPDTVRLKFYFQHLSPVQKKKIVEAMNARTINFGPPGRFYVLPYFVQRETAGQESAEGEKPERKE